MLSKKRFYLKINGVTLGGLDPHLYPQGGELVMCSTHLWLKTVPQALSRFVPMGGNLERVDRVALGVLADDIAKEPSLGLKDRAITERGVHLGEKAALCARVAWALRL
jgi:hypothetical protein